jgi:hypothetical protein
MLERRFTDRSKGRSQLDGNVSMYEKRDGEFDERSQVINKGFVSRKRSPSEALKRNS